MKCGLATKILGRYLLLQDGTLCHCKIRNVALCHLAECSVTVFKERPARHFRRIFHAVDSGKSALISEECADRFAEHYLLFLD